MQAAGGKKKIIIKINGRLVRERGLALACGRVPPSLRDVAGPSWRRGGPGWPVRTRGAGPGRVTSLGFLICEVVRMVPPLGGVAEAPTNLHSMTPEGPAVPGGVCALCSACGASHPRKADLQEIQRLPTGCQWEVVSPGPRVPRHPCSPRSGAWSPPHLPSHSQVGAPSGPAHPPSSL